MAGLAVFTVGSLACGLAESQGVLIGARFAQGVGGAMTSAVILGIIATMFTDPRQQATAIGVYTFVAAGGGSLGLVLGGVLTDALDWHWIFYVNVPIGIAVAAVAGWLVERDRGIGLRKGADVPGAVLVTAGLMLAIYTIVESSERGWGSGHTIGFGALALALLAAFVVWERTTRTPLVPLRIFRSRNMSGANVVQVFMVGGMFGMFFLATLYFQRVLGYDALEVGLAHLPSTLVIGLLSLGVTPRLNGRFGLKATLLAGLVLIGCSLLLFTRAPVDASYASDVLPVMLLLGAGVGLAFPSLVGLAMSGATPQDSGLASGVFNTTQQVGSALGLAVLATVATERTETLSAEGESLASALTEGYQLGFLVGAGSVAIALCLAIAVLRTRLPEAAPAGDEQAVGDQQPEPAGA